MPSPQILHTHSRAFAGCIVTLVNPDTHELRVRHAAGYSIQSGSSGGWRKDKTTDTVGVLDSLRRLIREVERSWEGTWKIRTISTPQTIWVDLKGRLDGHEGSRPSPPEAQILTQIERIDMWEGHHANIPRARERAAKRRAKKEQA